MTIMILDGQGGGVGKSLVDALSRALPSAELIAVGTNSAATLNMVKGTKIIGATGESAVIFNADHADLIVAPLSAFLVYGMQGEISPQMATALASCKAQKIAIPSNSKDFLIVSRSNLTLSQKIEDAVVLVKECSIKA